MVSSFFIRRIVMNKYIFPLFIFLVFIMRPADAGFTGSLQGGAVFTSYNDVALPGDDGTRFSYSDDLDAVYGFSPRVEAGYEFGFPLYAGVMASLLRLDGDGKLDKDVKFGDKVFNESDNVKGTYRFDSYRATLRWYFINGASFKIGGGLTGKIRDAEITLEDNGEKESFSNTGVVPLLNFYAEWIASPAFSLLFYGDGTWSPYGRAEDFFAGAVYRFHKNYALMAGYRILEGGADNDRVYTFSMFHYAVAGLQFSF